MRERSALRARCVLLPWPRTDWGIVFYAFTCPFLFLFFSSPFPIMLFSNLEQRQRGGEDNVIVDRGRVLLAAAADGVPRWPPFFLLFSFQFWRFRFVSLEDRPFFTLEGIQ